MRDFADFGDNSGENAEAAMLIASLREVIRRQATQIEELQTKLQDTENARVKEVLFHLHSIGGRNSSFFPDLGTTSALFFDYFRARGNQTETCRRGERTGRYPCLPRRTTGKTTERQREAPDDWTRSVR